MRTRSHFIDSSAARAHTDFPHVLQSGRTDDDSKLAVFSRPRIRERIAGFGGHVNSGVSLYTRRVLIQENTEKLLPPFLRFVRGVVDCETCL